MAAGTLGRQYPWGSEYQSGRANIHETGLKYNVHLARTTAVGLYPTGKSPKEAFDLSGNVWEWCLNEYYKPDNIAPSGEEWRVLRGGSWLLNPDFACARVRYRFNPGIRSNDVGFRLLSESPILNADH